MSNSTAHRRTLGAIVPNAGPPAPTPHAAAHQSPLPWVPMVIPMAVAPRTDAAERN